MLIGERPGLSSPGIVGAQLTLQPTVERTDAQHNCVSNSHPQGLAPADAARRSTWLLRESMHRQLMGVALKDASEAVFVQGLQELLQRRGLRLR